MSPILQFKRGSFSNLPGLRAGEPGFTTDRSDFYVGLSSSTETNKFFGSARYWTRENGTNAAEFKLVDKSGDVGVSLRAPATVSTPVTYTLPQGGGTIGHVLKLGNSGVLEWASVTSGASFDNVIISNSTFSGISTFSGLIDANAGLDVTGHTELDNLNVTGVSTFVGVSTFNSDVYIGGLLYVDGITLGGNGQATYGEDVVTRNISASGIITATGLIDANGGLDVTGQTILNNNFSVTGVSTFTGAITANGNVTLGSDSSDTLTVNANTTFLGTVTGTISTATRATQVDTTATSTAGTYYIPFVSNSSSTTSETIRVDAGISYNPDSNTLEVATVETTAIKYTDGTASITIDSSGNVGVATNLTVSGNLTVNGSTTTVDTETLLVKDSLIEVGLIDNGSGQLIPPTSDANIDVGMVFHYYSGSAKNAAVYWDDSEGRIAFASEVSEANSILTATTYATILAGGLEINNACTGGTDIVISCVNNELALSNIVVDGGSF